MLETPCSALTLGLLQYDAVVNYYRTAKTADERNTALRSLGRAKDPALIKRSLAMLFGGEVKDQDIYMPASGLRSHGEGIEALFEWMQANWEELIKRLPPGQPMLSAMVSIFTSSFTTQQQLDRVQEFFKGKDTKGFDQSLAQSLDAIRSKVSWVARDSEDVSGWLKSNGYLA
jgi:aminopeptidase 2